MFWCCEYVYLLLFSTCLWFILRVNAFSVNFPLGINTMYSCILRFCFDLRRSNALDESWKFLFTVFIWYFLLPYSQSNDFLPIIVVVKLYVDGSTVEILITFSVDDLVFMCAFYSSNFVIILIELNCDIRTCTSLSWFYFLSTTIFVVVLISEIACYFFFHLTNCMIILKYVWFTTIKFTKTFFCVLRDFFLLCLTYF